MVLVVVGVLGAVVLGYLAQSFSTIIALIGLTVVFVVAAFLRNNPMLIVPALVFSMWFEGLGAGQATVGRLLAALVPLLIVALVATTRWRPRALEPRGWVPVALLITWAWAGGLYAIAVGGLGGWFYQFLTLFLGVAYFLGMAAFLDGPLQLERLMRTWVLLGAPIALLGLAIFLTLGNRIFGFTGGPNTYAAYVVEALPLIVVFARRETGRRKALFYLLIPVYLGGLLATGSRGGMIGAAVVGLYTLVTLPGLSRARRIVAIFSAPILLFAALMVFGLLNAERFSLGALLTDRGAGRQDIWNAGFQVMKDHWIVGLGLGGFPSKAIQFIQTANNGDLSVLNSKEVQAQGGINAHNVYLAITLDMGIIGLTLYLGVLAATIKNLWDLRRTLWGDLAWAFIGAVLGNMVAGMFGAQFNHKFLWLIAGAAASAYYRRRLTPRQSARSSPRLEMADGTG